MNGEVADKDNLVGIYLCKISWHSRIVENGTACHGVGINIGNVSP